MNTSLNQELHEFLIPTGIETLILKDKEIKVPAGTRTLTISMIPSTKENEALIDYGFFAGKGNSLAYDAFIGTRDDYKEFYSYCKTRFEEFKEEPPLNI